MLRLFEDLGDAVGAQWEKTGKDDAAFPEIAVNALAESRVLEKIDRDQIVAWLMRGERLPEQMDNEFGQPPVKLYQGDKFRIDALFWVDSTTSVHEHGFGGAFGVLSGSSVQSTYTFELEKQVSPRFLTGRVNYLSSELLNRGDLRKIVPGDTLIHSLFHLDRPSVSLVVRTAKGRSERPQYEYKRPFVALDPFFIPTSQVIQRRMLRSLLDTDEPEFWRAANELVSVCEAWMLYHVLSIAQERSSQTNAWQGLLANVRPEHSALVQPILACLREEYRLLKIIGLRSGVHDPVHRFFLALLLNVPTREQICSLIVQRFPGEDPNALILRWLSEIFSEPRLGLKLTPSLLFLFKIMMENPDFEDSKARLGESFGVGAGDTRLRDAWALIHSVDMFQPLFPPSQARAAGAA